MKRVLALCITVFQVFLLIGGVSMLHAGQVTLEISTTTSISQGFLSANFRITNKGTDAAHEISVKGNLIETEQSVFIASRLGPGQSADGNTTFSLPENLSGSYPLYITVYYQHADGISVSSASLAHVIIGSPGLHDLNLKTILGHGAKKGEVSLRIDTLSPDIDSVSITTHGPDDIAIEPHAQKIPLDGGRGMATFTVKNITGNEGSVYGIFFAAEHDRDGVHSLATADIAVPVEKAMPVRSHDAQIVNTWLLGAFLLILACLLLAISISSRLRKWLIRIESVPHILDILVLLAGEIFIFSQFDLPTLFAATITTGGDTASHYYTLEYLRHTLLPGGQVSGWTMGNYGGFPILQFYFPLPFLIMCLLDLVMPLQVAFKMGTLLGTALLPAAAYTMLRLIRCPFPGPGIGAMLMLPFLFNSANSMWGGNILSTLAGEFSYSLSMALSLILIGSLYRGALEDKWVGWNAILVFLVGFSHGYTLLFAEAISLFILVTPTGFIKRALYLFKVYALGFFLLAFWLVPLLVFTKYTTSYHLVWTIHSIKEVVPEILFPFVVAGTVGSFLLLGFGIIHFKTSGKQVLSALAYLWFGLAAAVVFFVAAPRIGVVDIRYVPYGQLMTCLMAALFLGWAARYFLNRWGLSWLLIITVAAGVMHWTESRVGPVRDWSKWNYEGFESKKTWPLFEQINSELQGSFQAPRVVFEHSQDHNMFGSSRAFESLPLFAGRATLEGLYMQASITAPFVFYIQSLISQQSSQPFPQYNYAQFDLERARDFLKLFNVRELILKSSMAKQAASKVSGYSKAKSLGQYEIWELTTNPDRYVEPLQYAPVAYTGEAPWKQVAHQWFSRDELHDVHLVFNAAPKDKNTPLALSAGSLAEIPRKPVDISACDVKEHINDQEIVFTTSCPGKPHLVKVSYHPNWQVHGAENIYLVSPSFMLVYPKGENIRLYYGPGRWNRLGRLMTIAGILVLLLNATLPGTRGQSAWSFVSTKLGLPASFDFKFIPNPNLLTRKIMLTAVIVTVAVVIALGSYRTYVNEPYRIYNQSIQYKDSGNYEQARAGFRSFMEQYPLANLAQESSYYIGITYYLEKQDEEAIKALEEYLQLYPSGNRAAEVHYHLGLVLLRSGKKEEAIDRLRLLIEKYSSTPWAQHARDRLQEQDSSPSDVQLNINSSNLNQYMGRAIAYFNQDRLEDAKPILMQISEYFPDFAGAPQALAVLALCYYKEGDCQNTVKYYGQLIQRYPDHRLAAEAYFHLGLCFEKTGNQNSAQDAYEKVLQLDPGGVFGSQARTKIVK